MPFQYSWITPEEQITQRLRTCDLFGYITNSSAYHKGMIKDLPIEAPRDRFMQAYQHCRNYATQSIVSQLTPVKQFAGKHLYCSDSKRPFHILARVRTDYDCENVNENAAHRYYQSFSILENKNLSHFPGKVLYGYYTGVTPEMIGYIYPMDANTCAGTQDRLLLSSSPEILLDLDDLITKARKHGSYCQLSIFTRCKTPVGTIAPLRPDCIIAIDEVDHNTQAASKAENLPILTIHRAPDTLYHVHDDCLEASYWTDWILPIDPNAPRYDEYDDIDITNPEHIHTEDETNFRPKALYL